MDRDVLDLFRPPVGDWFRGAFRAPTRPERQGWPAIASGGSALILAPTGTGKTLTAFLWCLDRLMFDAVPDADARCRVLYISPLRALAVDVERNLRVPLTGIANAARARDAAFHMPAIAIRTGDTPAADRERFRRQPADILITTPESLFLLLTSAARERLRSVDTVIVDEVHALVSTKRGAHLALSLERLERLTGRPVQRIGLSATQRPLDEVARFLGGADARAVAPDDGPAPAGPADTAHVLDLGDGAGAPPVFRPVTIVDASEPKRLEVSVQSPVEDMARMAEPSVPSVPSAPSVAPAPSAASVASVASVASAASVAVGARSPGIWAAIHPSLVETVRAHRSTLIFVNNRRLAERIAGAVNELAGEPLVRAHHGSLARQQRIEIEDLLKTGRLRGLVATSSLELGIDMGAIDMVVQIEAPPSVASGIQRIGRAGHHVDAVSRGVIVPKYRGDLVAAAAITRAMMRGDVEPSRYVRNPLDVLAQQLVAMTAVDTWGVDDLFAAVRQAAPFAELGRRLFDGVLDMLSGRYPSDEFAELRPRVTWDRVAGLVSARHGAGRMAIANAGTIPDRGLYGVFLAADAAARARVGELDEEMVFEARAGETFVLGASTWRIEQITHDRVLVSPAPGEPGKMPFWKGEAPGRPLALGLAIGQLVRELGTLPRETALARLDEHHGLDARAAANLLQYIADQVQAAGAVPDDRTIVIERTRDDLGDWRVAVLSPLGGRVHAPWVMAVAARIRAERGLDVETMWSDDGFVVRFPDADQPPDHTWMLPDPDEVEALVVGELGGTALFAARFREAAGRALLLPRRRPGARAPLWQTRKRAADLLAVAAKFGSFPIVLETYRECLRDVFDMPALADVLRRVRSRTLRVVALEADRPSPFAASLLFTYAANYIYDGDAPLAERRARALTIDHAELRDLIGDIDIADMLDARELAELERELQRLPPRLHARSLDGVHDILLALGDMTAEEIAARVTSDVGPGAPRTLVALRRAIEVGVGGERRFIAVEDAARYRDALGTPLPSGVPDALLEPVADPIGDLVKRFARTHGPFTVSEPAARLGLGADRVQQALTALIGSGRLLEGRFRPGGTGIELVDAEVFRVLRHRSLARARRAVEPVARTAYGRFLVGWHGVGERRRGLDALLDTLERLQGVPLVASLVETEILPARIADFDPAALDTLMAAGEVTWMGVEPLGDRDGRVAFYLTDNLATLAPPAPAPPVDPRGAEILAHLQARGASFFGALHEAAGGGFPQETVDALWSLVWSGFVTNDAMHALRAYVHRTVRSRRRGPFRSRRLIPASAEGRWDRVGRAGTAPSAASHAAAWADVLLGRHGIVTREVMGVESVPGGFQTVYPVLRRLEEAGRIRRGYFVTGLGGAQFAMPGALDALRLTRDAAEVPAAVILAATDPANPYGVTMPWPAWPHQPSRSASRSSGARVVLVDGRAAAWIARGNRQLLVSLPADEPERSSHGRALAHLLVRIAREIEDGTRGGWLIEEINGRPASGEPAAEYLRDAGFATAARHALQFRPVRANTTGPQATPANDEPSAPTSDVPGRSGRRA